MYYQWCVHKHAIAWLYVDIFTNIFVCYLVYNKILKGDMHSFTDNAGLCGIPGLGACGPHLSTSAKIGIGFGVLGLIFLLIICSMVWWKRRQNILRAQQIAGKDIHSEQTLLREYVMLRAQFNFRISIDDKCLGLTLFSNNVRLTIYTPDKIFVPFFVFVQQEVLPMQKQGPIYHMIFSWQGTIIIMAMLELLQRMDLVCCHD